MGAHLCLTACAEVQDPLDKHERARLEALQQGRRFIRKRTATSLAIPLGSEPVMVRVSEDQSAVVWRTLDNKGAPQHGDVHISAETVVNPTGDKGLVILDPAIEKPLELEADDPAVRDSWVMSLVEVIARVKLTAPLAAPADDKSKEYWAARQKELKDREEAAAEKKRKYSGSGMQYTAQHMAARA